MVQRKVLQLVRTLDLLAKFDKALEPLHSSQQAVMQSIFPRILDNRLKQAFVQCGRRWGKSQLVIDIARRYAFYKPNANIYIICPFRHQVKEVYWSSHRLSRAIPKQFWAKNDRMNKHDLRYNFINGSFIKLCGADNIEALRGITPDLVIIDEYKDIKKDFEDTIEPAVISNKAPIIILGTPPRIQGLYTEKRDYIKKQVNLDPDGFFYISLPSHDNPLLDREWLKKKELEYRERGEYGIWKREFLAEDAYSEGGYVFPMFSTAKHVIDGIMLKNFIDKDKHKLRWLVSCDPGTTTAFGVNLIAYNEVKGSIYICDELYAVKPHETTTASVWEGIKKMLDRNGLLNAFYDGKVDMIYDDAAAWFRNEMIAQYGINIFPVKKRSKDDMISAVRDFLLKKYGFFVNANCFNTVRQLQHYAYDEVGKIIKKDDHLVDCIMYAIKFLKADPMVKVDNDDWDDFAPDNLTAMMKSTTEIVGDLNEWTIQNDWLN